MKNNPIGVFDSGVGGLNVLNKCVELLPHERFIYLADEANMPYGNKPPEEIKLAATACADRLFSLNCKALVIACNTATATAIDDVRLLYPSRIVIGLEPAVKPCYRELGRTGYAVALVTNATYRSAKFNRLLQSCEGKIIPLVYPELAQEIERNVGNIQAIKPKLFEVLGSYRDAEAIILGCSHYTYVKDIISEFYYGNVKIYDGADGAAARLKYCLELADLISDETTETPPVTFLSTFKK